MLSHVTFARVVDPSVHTSVTCAGSTGAIPAAVEAFTSVRLASTGSVTVTFIEVIIAVPLIVPCTAKLSPLSE